MNGQFERSGDIQTVIISDEFGYEVSDIKSGIPATGIKTFLRLKGFLIRKFGLNNLHNIENNSL